MGSCMTLEAPWPSELQATATLNCTAEEAIVMADLLISGILYVPVLTCLCDMLGLSSSSYTRSKMLQMQALTCMVPWPGFLTLTGPASSL